MSERVREKKKGGERGEKKKKGEMSRGGVREKKKG